MSEHDAISPEANVARSVLRDMWSTRRGEARADLDSLVSMLEFLATSPTEIDVRRRSQELAHQLVGVFAVFGFAQLKTDMAHVDIELSDVSVPIRDVLHRVQGILSALP